MRRSHLAYFTWTQLIEQIIKINTEGKDNKRVKWTKRLYFSKDHIYHTDVCLAKRFVVLLFSTTPTHFGGTYENVCMLEGVSFGKNI